MTGAELALLISSISAGAAQGAAASAVPTGAKMAPFIEDEGAKSQNYYYSDPRGLMQSGTRGLRQVGGALADVARQPYAARSSFVQPLPTFHGGGLPMPIGVRAFDPALSNPGLLVGPGTDITGSPDIDPTYAGRRDNPGPSADPFPKLPGSPDTPPIGDAPTQALAALDMMGLGEYQPGKNLFMGGSRTR